MAADNFQNCLALVLKYEGGKSEDPNDPGGKTMEGITQATYDAWLRKQGRNGADVFTIPAVDRNAIYRNEFWDIIKGDALRHGEDLVVFDLAVNSGPSRALRIWTQAGGAQETLTAIIDKVSSIRLSFLQGLRTWQYFGKGWYARVNTCRTSALKMASEALQQPPIPIPVPIPQPLPEAPLQPLQPIPAPSYPPASPVTSGRQAAVLDQLLAIQQNYADEIAALQREKAVIDQSIQSFSGFLPPPQPLPSPKQKDSTVSSREEIVASTIPPKPALSSKTIWGGIISLAGPVLDMLLNYVTTNNGVPGIDPKYNSMIVSATSLIGGFMAIYGRNKPEIAPIKGIISSK